MKKLLLLLLLVSSAQAQLTVRVGMFPNITHMQALVASNMTREGNGWFESRLGVPVKLEWSVYNAGPSAMEGIFTRAIDMTYVGPSPAVNAYARANGKDVRVMSAAMRGGEALVVRGDSIQKPADLRGKTIATPQLGNTQDVECRAWLLQNGIRVTLTGGDARVIPISNPDMLPLFKDGKFDAAWTVEPWVTRLLNEANGRIFKLDENALTTILVGREAFLDDNPEIAKRFLEAHRELTAWIIANPAEAQERVRAELSALARREIPASLVAQAWSRLHPATEISVDPFERFLTHAREVGFLRAQVNLNQLLWNP